MSTNSCIAIGQGSNLRGRYCHSDGYPTHQGRALWTIVQRDGLETARQTLLHDHRGWSFLDPTREDWDSLKGEMHDLVDGYGLAYNDEPDDVWADPFSYEWTYVLDDHAMHVCYGNALLASVRWDGREPDWETIERKGWG